MADPAISIVTPSFNQGRYLGETIDSILDQAYPSLDYIVMDGGSADQSVDVIRARQERLAFWRSHPDHGQAAAINEGFARARGAIFGWLNSDDLHMNGTLHIVADMLTGCVEEAVVLYGSCELFRDNGSVIERRSAVPFDLNRLQITDFLDQPSVFFTRAAWERVGPLDDSLHYAFDWEWFLRASKVCRFLQCDKILSRYRIHAQHKTGTGGLRRWEEMSEVVRRHSPEEVVRHYQYLLACPDARWWLNKRMRLAQLFQQIFSDTIGGAMGTVCAPPFWHLPEGISRAMLWEISGIR
ncbi:MAG: glycosyltransferase [Verrucomicrobia bacterium]|nr:glycosyltransferase [Verrucomicrobiota bacterium]MBV8274250.1 glycosyltransferase [Verrucomicrobiota bacterium]